MMAYAWHDIGEKGVQLCIRKRAFRGERRILRNEGAILAIKTTGKDGSRRGYGEGYGGGEHGEEFADEAGQLVQTACDTPEYVRFDMISNDPDE